MGEKFGFKVGDVVEVQVLKIHNFGAFVRLPDNKRGLIHISQVSDDFVKDIKDYLKAGDKVEARIKKITADGKIDLTLKKKRKVLVSPARTKEFKISPFHEKIDEFLKKEEENS